MTLSLPLQIRYSPTHRLPPVAWYLSGDATTWLSELSQWQLPLREMSLIPLEHSGVLVVLKRGQKLSRPINAIPMGCVANLYLPTNASFNCEFTTAEATALLPPGIAAGVFLPDGRIIAVTPEQILSVKDLLKCEPTTGTDWDHADPGNAFNERLLTVLPLHPPTLQSVLESGRDEISSQPFTNTPPTANEPTNTLWDQAGRAARQAAANVAQWIAQRLQANSAPAPQRLEPFTFGQSAPASSSLLGTLAKSLQKWSTKITQRVAQNLDEIRNRELLRLMEMLKNNPDEGLKYAIPFGGEATRGIGAAGGRLTQRNVDFTLSGGGGPADFWDISEQHRNRLRTHYRELANRELNLGRFRRAAYILSHLLGDIVGAAGALEAGGHWREAAVLFAEKLNQPRAAADCLLRGGLIQEAIERFEALGLHEIVGDLYHRLEQPEDAAVAWRRAAETHSAASNLLEAARIYENKLKEIDGALQLLSGGWEANIIPDKCLLRYFEILARTSQHDLAVQRFRLLREEPVDKDRNLLAAETLANVLASYPDRQVCHQGIDLVRVLAARHLRLVGTASQRRWVTALKTVGSNDKMIARDGERFLTTFVPPQPPPAPVPPRPAPRTAWPKIARHNLKIATLPKNVVWKAVAVGDNEFYIAGVQNRTLQLWRGDFTGAIQQGKPRHVVAATDDIEVQLAVPPHASSPVLVLTNHDISDVEWIFPEFGSHFRGARAFLANFASGQLVASCYAIGARYDFFREEDRCWGNAHQIPGGSSKLTGTFELVPALFDDGDETHFLPVVGQPSFLAVAAGSALHVAVHPQQRQSVKLAEPIRRLAASQPFSRFRLAAANQIGGYYFSAAAGFRLETPIRFSTEVTCPEICFTGAGHLIAVAQANGEIYTTANNEFKLAALIPRLSAPPIAVIPGNLPNQFAILLSSGAIEIYSVP